MRTLRLACSTGIALFLAGWLEAKQEEGPKRPEIRVGIDEGDIRGADNRALQAAIEEVARLGGGTVRIGPGRYLMRNALTLRNHVRIAGTPGKTVLAACDGAKSLLASDGDCRERQVTLADPSGFQVGDGILVRDDRAGSGFEVTTATLVARVDERTFRISAPLYLDYMMAQKASAAVAFPIVGGWNVRDATLEGLTVEGNREKRESLDGCRGGGIYLFESAAVTIRNCIVRNYNGDGISFQVCDDVTVEGCTAEQNSGLGIHPGSGSQRPIIRGNRSIGNGRDGIFVCWRVKHGIFEKNESRDNQGAGISIGHKDTDNAFRENTLTGNGRAGVLFRNESEPMGAHRNVFERNVILDNGRRGESKSRQACVVLQGCHDGVIFRGNTIGNSQAGGPADIGISLGKNVRDFGDDSNVFEHLESKIDREK
jgi:parallel beta-helix repeat protein